MRANPLQLLAVAALVLACGTSPSKHAACKSSSDCKTGEMCHPLALLCVQTCTQDADCPDSASHCGQLKLPDGTLTADRICQCSDDGQCGGGDGICGTEDRICEPKCATDADCQGRTCDTSTGQCHSASP